MTRFNDIVFTKISHIQYDMLSMLINKDQIKNLVKKICKNCHAFPETYLSDLMQKIDLYKPNLQI